MIAVKVHILNAHRQPGSCARQDHVKNTEKWKENRGKGLHESWFTYSFMTPHVPARPMAAFMNWNPMS